MPFNLKPAQGKKHLFSNIQQMRVQIMEEERAERSVHEKLLFEAQIKEIRGEKGICLQAVFGGRKYLKLQIQLLQKQLEECNDPK